VTAPTKAKPLPSVDEQQAQLDAERDSILRRQAELDAAVMEAFDAGAPVDELVAEQMQLRARWAALDMVERQLGGRRDAETAAEVLADYETYTKALAAIYALMSLKDKQAAALRAQLRELAEERTELNTQLQLPFGRRLKLIAQVRTYGLKAETREIDKQYQVPGYFG
jgi:phage shock protein A